MFRTKPIQIHPTPFVEMLKNRPNEMIVTASYIAVWHSGLQTAIMIPGHFEHVNDAQANLILQANLDKINAMQS